MQNRSIELTAQTRLKHAALLRASRKLGGVMPLAEYCGVSSQTMENYLLLRKCPPEHVCSWWPAAKLNAFKSAITSITELSYEELFPDELRKAVQCNEICRIHEQTKKIPLAGLIEYAESNRERFLLPSPEMSADKNELKRQLRKALELLTERERLLFNYRYGLSDGIDHTLEECGKHFGVGKERIRQIECKAIRKLQQSERSRLLCDWA